LPVHWQEVFLAEDTAVSHVVRTTITASEANLHYRGFSESNIDPRREQPDTYGYRLTTSAPFWNPTPGFYTRFGDVLALARDVDDKLIVMGSGDELTLRFPARDLPPLKAGWTRDFLLKVDGWAKDRDANTAYGGTVDPLPFHRMSVYPYPQTEHFPNDEGHVRYRKEYNTRPALRPLRALTE
jgi:hypothetical protein